MKSLMASLLSLGCLLAAGPVHAHFSLDFPKARSGEIDTHPCGGNPSKRGNIVTTFRPGQSVKLQWNVFVTHTTPGRWRISIDDSGQDFPDPVGASDTSTLPFFMDNVEASGATMQELTVTLPNIECNDCTMQMLQYKYEKPPYTDPSSFYYQCADIVISSDPNATGGAPSAGGMPAGGSAAGGSSPTSSSGTGSSGSPATPATAGTGSSSGSGTGSGSSDSGGCRFASPRAGSDASISLLALVLLCFQRRRQRHSA